ncbi:MAG: tetratricopeptide repeat protein [Ignavibacteria bacterium]|nr:tetratricopeptide repeat protein [Ignavibacteria bacterium]
MGKTAKNIFDEKVSLIYEYNKKSPLFVREANTEIFANNVEKAVEILTQGLGLFPNYPTAYIVLAKALTMLGQYDEALASFKKGCELINSETSYNFFAEEVASSKKLRSAFGKIPRQPFTFENDFDEGKSASDIYDSEPLIVENNFEDRLDEIAEQIAAIKMPPPEHQTREIEKDSDFPSEVKIASETLAKIYVAQGEFQEAIEMYKRLIPKNPAKKEYFLARISELQAKYNLD